MSMRRRQMLATAALAIAGAALPLPAGEKLKLHYQVEYPIVDSQNNVLGVCREVGELAGTYTGQPAPRYDLSFFAAPPPLLFYWADRQMVRVEYEGSVLRPVRMRIPQGT